MTDSITEVYKKSINNDNRSKAPLRLGLAGGGTDVSPIPIFMAVQFFNATVSLYAYASIEPRADNIIA